MKRIVAILFGLLVFSGQFAQASVIDAPHNETYQFSCGTCHSYSIWWQYSPSICNDSPDHSAIVNTVCMACHDEGGFAPLAKTHSAIVMGSTTYHSGNWVMVCTDCHNPHYQNQLNWVGSATEPFLITGTIDSVSIDIDNLQTTVTYSNASANGNWPAVGGTDEALDWANKNASGRGLIFVHDSSLTVNTFIIVSATANQIVINGILDPSAVDPATPGNPATSNTFGLIYGQLIRDVIATPASGSKNVRFFDATGGFSSENTDGVCQVCHTVTKHFINTGEVNVGVVENDHIAHLASNCTLCHIHSNGFSQNAPQVPLFLAWTGETGFVEAGVNPLSGANGQDYEFRVGYASSGNIAPTQIEVWVDQNDNSVYEIGEQYALSETDAGDTTYSDGKVYAKTLALTHSGDGVLNFRFQASDGTNSATGDPVADSQVTVAATALSTTVGTATAIATGDSSIAVQMPYTDDFSANNTYTVEYKLSSSETWSGWGTNPKLHAPSPYEGTITGLIPGESYDLRLTYNDSDGVIGSSVQTITDIVLPIRTVDLTVAVQGIAEEAGSGMVTATLSDISGHDVTLPYTVGGTASGGGIDHDLADGSIIVSAGQLTGTASFTIIDDGLDEADETLVVTMGLPVKALAGTVTVQTITFTDNDPTPTVTFTSPLQSTADESGTATITAQLSAVSGRDVTVPFTINGASTATGSGIDYTISATPVSITAGTTTADITVTVVPDGDFEVDETIIIDMGSPTNATASGVTTHTVTIIEDDFPPTAIYRSVGPGNTTALESGSGNDLTISGSTATFALGVADTIGVGDAIQYDSDNNASLDAIAFISGRTSATSFTLQDADGLPPTATVTADQDWQIFRAYISLANAEQGIENTAIALDLRNFDDWTPGGDATSDDVGKDLVAANQQWHIACYNDAIDVTSVDIDGWTTGPDMYIRIFTPTGISQVGISQRHDGTASTGYRLSSDAIDTWPAIYLREEYIRVEGLVIDGKSSELVAGYRNGFQMSTGATGFIAISDCILHDVEYAFRNFFYVQSVIANTIAYDINAYGVYGNLGDTDLCSVLNSTFVRAETDADNMVPGIRYCRAINNAVFNYGGLSGYRDFMNLDPGSSNNMSSDDSGDDVGGGGVINQILTDHFIDTSFSSANFHLLPTSSGLDAGTDLSGDPVYSFSTDIDGQTRSGSWDIGTDEYSLIASNVTVTDTATAVANGDSAIDVAMPYSGDDNADSTYTVEYKLSAAGSYSTHVSEAAHTVSPYTTTIPGLAAGTYDVRVTYNDGDGITGSNPQTVSNITIGQIVSGTVYADEGVTPIADGATVRLIVNGVSAGTDTTSSGAYSIPVDLSAGDAMLVYVDGAASDGTTVTVSGGTSVSGLDIYANRLITRHDNAGSLTNALMNTALGAYSDAEILYSVSGGDLTVSGVNTELFIPAGQTFVPGGAVTTGDMDINGTLNGAANAITVAGHWDASGGVFISTGTVTFNAASGTKIITPGGVDADHDFQHIVFNDGGGSATFQLAGPIDVDGNFTVTDGIFDTKSGANYNVTVGGNFVDTAAGRVEGRWMTTFTVGGDFTFDGNSNQADSSGLSYIQLVMTGAGTLTMNNVFDPWTYGVSTLTVGQNGNTTTLISNNSFSVRKLLTIGSGSLTGAANLYMNYDSTFAFDPASTLSLNTIFMHGNDASIQNLPALANGYDATIKLTGPNTTVNQTGNVVINAPHDFSMDPNGQTGRTGVYTTNGFDLTVGGDLTVGFSGDNTGKVLNAGPSAIAVGGNFTVDASATFTSTGTVTFNATSGTKVINPGGVDDNHDFQHVVLNDGGGSATFQLAGPIDVDGNFTVTDGIFDTKSGANYNVTVGGNFVDTAAGRVEGRWMTTFTVGGDFTFDGNSNQADSSGLSYIQLVMTGAGTLTMNNVFDPWTYGVSTLTVGQNGNTTTLISNNSFSVRKLLTIGSGSLTGAANLYMNYDSTFAFDPASTLSLNTIFMHGNDASIQNLPALANGYDATIKLTGPNTTVNQTGNVVINAPHDFSMDPNGQLGRTGVYTTNGFDLTVGGDLTVGFSGDNTGKVLNAGPSAIAVGGNFTVDASATFTSTGTVTFNATSGTKVINPGGVDDNHDFQHLVLNDGGGSATFKLGGAINTDGNFTITDGIFDTDAAANYAVTVGGNFNQSAGQTLGNSATFTVAGDFIADGTVSPTGFNNASLVMTGDGTALIYNNLAEFWANGFNNLTVGGSGATTTLYSWLAVRNLLSVGSGNLTGSATIALLGSPNPLSLDPAANVSVDSLVFLAWGGPPQNLPSLPNGYDSNISVSGDGLTLTQTGNVTINTPKSLLIKGDNDATRANAYSTAGFDLTVGKDIIIGAGNDTALKTLNGTGSAITVRGNFTITPVGGGSTQATFTATGSTVVLNGTSAQAVTSSGQAFNDLTVTNNSTVVTFADAFTAVDFTVTTAGTQLTFQGGSTNTISGTLDLNGQASGTKVLLRSSDTSQYILNVTGGDQTVHYVDVQYAAASGNDITAIDFTDNGNNDDGEASPHWVFFTNTAPVLNWSGETDYVSDGAEPESMTTCKDSVVFRVEYTDADNHAPAVIQVWVDEDDSGIYEAGEKYDLTGEGDATYSTGRIYTTTLDINGAGDNTIAYRFHASDGMDNASGTPVSDKTMTFAADLLYVPTGYASIQAGIDAASTGNMVCVAAGTYSENINFSGKAITVQGFDGADSTTIQGSGANSPVVTFNSSETSSAVLDGFTLNNQILNNAARGISITGGAAPTIKNSVIKGNELGGFDGAGIYINGATATLQDTTIGGDVSAQNNAANGGGIYVTGLTGELTITGCTISHNTGNVSGGLYLNANGSVQTTIINSTFSNNSANWSGAALNATDSKVSISGSTFNDNTVASGGSGGGALYIDNSLASVSAVISNTDFIDNESSYRGGAIYVTTDTNTTTVDISGGSFTGNHNTNSGGAIYLKGATTDATLENATLTGNSSYIGAAVFVEGSPLTITDTVMDSNTGTGQGGGICITGVSAVVAINGGTINSNTGQLGGGIALDTSATLDVIGTSINGNNATGTGWGPGGGIHVSGSSILNLTKATVKGNTAYHHGGGIYNASGTVTLTNCLVSGNAASTSGAHAGGIHNKGTLNIYSSTIAGNYANAYGGALLIEAGTATVTNSILWDNSTNSGSYLQIYGTPTVTYSDVEGGFSGTGNIDSDPLFVLSDPAGDGTPKTSGDYHIQFDSPVIDQGTEFDSPVDDIDGQLRPMGGYVDIGADEAVTVDLTNVSQSVDEGEGTVTVTATLAAISDDTVIVPYTVSGTATGGTDHDLVNGNITVTAGQLTGSATFTVNNDILDEDDETVIVTMGSPTNATTGAVTVHTVTITDDDATPTVDLTSASQSVAEDVGSVTVTATLSAVSSFDVLVNFSVGGTAVGGGTDHSLGDGFITITAGQSTGATNFAITDDSLNEDDETVVVTMGAPVNAAPGVIGVHTVTITDNDAVPTVAFTTASQATLDETGTATITAQLSAVSGRNVSVPYTVNGSSTASGSGVDYSITASPVTIVAGSTSVDITVTVTSDVDAEGDETVIVDMGSPSNATASGTTSHTVTITDDDLGLPSGAVSYWNFDEGSGTTAGDSIGNNDGTVANPVWSSSGKSGNALSFNGSNSYVNIPASPLVLAGNTIEFWFQSSSNTGLRGIVETGDQVPETTPYLLVQNDNGTLMVYNAGTAYAAVAPITIGVWYHCAVVRTATNEKVYLNGVEKVNRAINTTGDNQQLHFGVGYNAYFSGLIDEITVYNSTLSAAEVQERYSLGLTASTTAGTATAVSTSSTSIDVSMPYTDDENADNTYTVDYKLSSEPTVWTNHVTGAAHTGSPYTTSISGLTPGADYDVRMTYVDGDGVSGTNPQIVTFVTTVFVPDGAIAYWKFDESSGGTAEDSIGNYDGTVTNATWTAAGKTNNALYCDGNADYVNVPSLTWAPTAFTVEFWLYPQSRTDYNQIIEATNGWGAFVFHTTSGGAVYVGTDLGGRLTPTQIPNGTLVLNEWQHFVFTYAGGVGTFYKNGAQVASKSGMSNPATWTGFQIGSGSTNTINGKVDEVLVYNRVLTSGEVQSRYTNSFITRTTAGTATATVTTGTTIAVSMPYTNDDNADNTYLVEYKESASGTWLDWGTNPKAHTASPYVDTITGLTMDTSYDIRLTYIDADGVAGTATQTLAGITPTTPSFAVTKTDDTNDGVCDADCSIREAVAAANVYSDANTIIIPIGTYVISRSGNDDTNVNGDYDITEAVNIVGAGSGATIIRAGGSTATAIDRIFHVTNASAVSIDGVTIQYGKVSNDGGCVYNSGTLTVKDSILDGCTAEATNDGGAIYSLGSLVLNNVALTTNVATNTGGAVYANGLTISNGASFVNNYSGNAGGAIYNTGTANEINGSGNIVFTNNDTQKSTNDQGGAIWSQGNITFTGTSNFTNNDAEYGGAIYLAASSATVVLGTTTFDSNTAPGHGGGLYTYGLVVNGNATFINNYVSGRGAGIQSLGANPILITGTATFTNNDTGNSTDDRGGGIWSEGTVTINGNANFTNNDAEYGGGIYLNSASATVSFGADATFAANTAPVHGGGLYTYGLEIAGNATFIDNYVSGAGAGVYSGGVNPVVIHGNATLTNNDTPQGTGDRGGAIYSGGGNLTIDGSCTASGNQAEYGGAIYLEIGSTTISGGANFTGNTAPGHGGAIYTKGLVITGGATFTDNNASSGEAVVYSGGANEVRIDGAVDFSRNTGGGIKSGGNVVLNPTTGTTLFHQNTGADTGGAITAAGTIFVVSPTFTENTAIVGNGGAISAGGLVTINGNATFLANSTTIHGGALDTRGLTINGNATFENNYSTGRGGGIQSMGANPVTIVGTATFINNDTQKSSGDQGGAIWSEGNVTISGVSYFANNDAEYGGAIYLNLPTATISLGADATFATNYAQVHGGALYTYGLEINGDASFTDNSAVSGAGGGVYSAGANPITISGNVILTNNDTSQGAGDRGGAIYSAGGNLTIDGSCTATDNQAEYGGAIHLEAGAATISGGALFTFNTSPIHGGAIFTNGLTITGGATFTDNNASAGEGVVYSAGANEVRIDGVTDFSRNTGGGIKSVGGNVVLNPTTGTSVFHLNTAADVGGAIYAAGSVSVVSPTFTGNTATIGNGGAISAGGQVTITGNAIFSDNSSNSHGGAVYASGVSITGNADFTNNYALNSGGGIRSSGANPVSIGGTATFTNNDTQKSTSDQGGGIWSEGNVTISGNANFTNNDAEQGGGIYLNLATATAYFGGDATFDTNTAVGGNGGGLFTYGVEIVGNATFLNNYVIASGAGIYSQGANPVVIHGNAVFTNNDTQKSTSDRGGAVYSASGNLTIDGSCTASGNQAEYGGAIYLQTGATSISGGANFSANDSQVHGGAIYTNGLTIAGGADFTGNYALGAGGAIYSAGANPVSIDGTVLFDNNDTQGQLGDDGGSIWAGGNLILNPTSGAVTFSNGYAYKGGAVFLASGKTLTATRGAVFASNSSYDFGGALVINGGTLTNVTFTDNYSIIGDGGAIYSDTNLLTINGTVNTFTNNYGDAQLGDEGGTIRSSGDLSIVNAAFTGRTGASNDFNEAYDGGAIFVASGKTLTVSDSSFSSYRAYNVGGAIRMYGGTMTNVSFTDNLAVVTSGGAIYNSTSPLTINGINSFTNNDASTNSNDRGGAIYTDGDLTISGATISGSNAFEGGAVFVNSPKVLVINDCTFDSNSAYSFGGAIRSWGGTISKSTFSNNTVTGGNNDGGAIYSNGVFTISNSTFSANSVSDQGGAIWQGANATIINSTFYNNSATTGEAIYKSTGTVSVKNSIVAKATASGSLCVNVTSGNYNLQYNGTCFTAAANDLSANPQLGALANNGGSTWTHALQAGSPAIDTADNATCAAVPVSNLDQTGGIRPVDGDAVPGAICDMGAFEYR